MLKNEKSANRIEHQNRKTEVFWHKNRKTDQKSIQNRKTENPNAPLQNEYLSFWPIDCVVHLALLTNLLTAQGSFVIHKHKYNHSWI